ncbi:MAG: ABC transporter permease [Veillonellaceae bacterium]|nr:ABC transporter permease [Veillonellaceae bacterium]
MRSGQVTPLFIGTGVMLAVFLAVAIFAPQLAPHPPDLVQRQAILAPMSAEHWLGTDALGRDVWSRLLYGARVSVFFAIAGAASTMLLGALLGILGGYFGGITDRAVQIAVHVFQGLPGMSLMIAIAGVLGPGTFSILLAVTLTSWTGFSRLVRAEVLRVRYADYVASARALGGSHLYILRKYIIPNILPTLVVLWTVRIGTVLLSVASLSFLGLGVQPPQADWGVMVFDAMTYFRSYPWLLLAPGVCIALFSICIQLWGDELRHLVTTERQAAGEDGR